MKNFREDIDLLIKETLSEEEAKFYDQLEQPGLLGMIRESFRGKNSWLMVLMNIVNLIALGLFIFCSVQLFKVSDVQNMIIWACGGFLCFITMAMIKIYAWMEMNKQVLLREMKRLEVQMLSLSSKLSS